MSKSKLVLVWAGIIASGTITLSWLGSQEWVAWDKAQKSNKMASYQRYLKKFPKGRHAAEAQQRVTRLTTEDEESWEKTKAARSLCAIDDYLAEFPDGDHRDEATHLRDALRRESLLADLSAKRSADSLSVRILGFFVHSQAQDPLRLDWQYVRGDQWPRDYSPTIRNLSLGDILEDFAKLIRVSAQRTRRKSAPFEHLTVVFKYSGRHYGDYKLSGGILGQTVSGIAIDVEILLFEPNQKVAVWTHSLTGSPDENISFPTTDLVTTWDTMRETIKSRAFGRVNEMLRDELKLQ